MAFHQYLLIRSSQPENAYGAFALEILKSEGLMGFELVDLDAQPFPEIGAGDLAVVTRCFLRDAEMTRLLDAAQAGAGLVFLRPQRRLCDRLGWQGENRAVHPAYVKIGDAEPLQTHLPVECCRPPAEGWDVLADLVDAEWRSAGVPGAACARTGQGAVALLLYDPAEAIARIRFGDPDLACAVTTGLWAWAHPADLFQGHLDERLAHLPQADLHAQFLARVITDVCPWPLARLWYYETPAQRTAAIVQSDGDWSEPEQFEALTRALEKRGGTGTFYLMTTTKLDEAAVAAFRERGHAFGPHVNPHDCTDEWYFDFERVLHEQTEQFKGRFGACSPTLQSHCAPWLGYVSWVPMHIANGYRLLFAYLSLPVKFWNRYLCGSGRPMRFRGCDGAVLNCWQQPVVTYDDASVKPMMLADMAAVRESFDVLLRCALDETHTALPILSHPVSFATYSSPFVEYTLDRLVAEGVPIYNADEWLAFTDRRAAVRTRQTRDADGAVVCELDGLRGSMTLMVPAEGACSVVVDGVAVEPVLETRLGRPHLFISVTARPDGRPIRVTVGV